MLSSNAPILCEFCVQNPSQNNVFSGTFYLWPWIWWMRQVNLLNKLQSQKGSHKKVVRMDFLAFSEPSSQNQWENDWADMNFKKIAIWTTLMQCPWYSIITAFVLHFPCASYNNVKTHGTTKFVPYSRIFPNIFRQYNVGNTVCMHATPCNFTD